MSWEDVRGEDGRAGEIIWRNSTLLDLSAAFGHLFSRILDWGTKGSWALWVRAHLYGQIDAVETPQYWLMRVITSLGTD